ncbi:MAG TPA: type IV pilus twitching motility protein PilT [bacterium]|nr:type IV pilus twitching motility protein PilT [bacterium]
MNLTTLLTTARERRASDLHLSVGRPPILRLDGRLVVQDGPAVTRQAMEQLLAEVLGDAQRTRFAEQHELDCSLDIPGVGRVRVNVFRQQRGEAAVFRLIPSVIRSLEDLGMPPVLAELCRRDRGLILITGPTGSGKTTTLAAMVDLMNRTRSDHIITIEDPIEFLHEPQRCLINQREVGPHTHSFAAALRSALREDPDIILVGEMRDLDTIASALTAAETGHLVLATLHTNSAPQTVNRIIDVFPPHQQEQVRVQLSEVLLGVAAQTLLPRADGKGRICAVEMLVATPAVRNLVREGKTFQLPSIIQTGTKEGMQTLDQSLKALVRAGVVTPEEALRRATDRALFSAPDAGMRPGLAAAGH